jgi:hypothetical protein
MNRGDPVIFDREARRASEPSSLPEFPMRASASDAPVEIQSPVRWSLSRSKSVHKPHTNSPARIGSDSPAVVEQSDDSDADVFREYVGLVDELVYYALGRRSSHRTAFSLAYLLFDTILQHDVFTKHAPAYISHSLSGVDLLDQLNCHLDDILLLDDSPSANAAVRSCSLPRRSNQSPVKSFDSLDEPVVSHLSSMDLDRSVFEAADANSTRRTESPKPGDVGNIEIATASRMSSSHGSSFRTGSESAATGTSGAHDGKSHTGTKLPLKLHRGQRVWPRALGKWIERLVYFLSFFTPTGHMAKQLHEFAAKLVVINSLK